MAENELPARKRKESIATVTIVKDNPDSYSDDQPIEPSEDSEEDEGGQPVGVVDIWGVEKMKLPEIKAMLKERDLSIRGDKKILSKRLIDRLSKEQNPEFKPKPRGRFCKWCEAPMKKRRGFKGDFYGCTSYPECQYTTSLSGKVDPKREALRGIPAGPSPHASMGRLDWARLRARQEESRQRKEDRRYERI